MDQKKYLQEKPVPRLVMRNPSKNMDANKYYAQSQPVNMFVITRTQPPVQYNDGNVQQNNMMNTNRQPLTNSNLIRKTRPNTYDETSIGANARNVVNYVQSVTYDDTFDFSQPMDDIPASVSKYPSRRTESAYPIQDSNSNQTLLSQYFVEKKNIDYKKSSQTGKEQKRSLKDLKQKYNKFDVSLNATRNENIQLPSYADQMTNVDVGLKQKLTEMNEQSREKLSISQKRRKIEVKEVKRVEPKMIHLIGHVENVLRWNHILKDVQIKILFNVLGTFISAMDGVYAMEKFVFIRGNNGTILECSFFEIDRTLPKLTKGQFVGCFGDIIGVQRFRLYSIDVLKENDRNDTQRAIFLSQRMTHELCNRKLSH